jgi:hypothetical protein
MRTWRGAEVGCVRLAASLTDEQACLPHLCYVAGDRERGRHILLRRLHCQAANKHFSRSLRGWSHSQQRLCL